VVNAVEVENVKLGQIKYGEWCRRSRKYEVGTDQSTLSGVEARRNQEGQGGSGVFRVVECKRGDIYGYSRVRFAEKGKCEKLGRMGLRRLVECQMRTMSEFGTKGVELVEQGGM
jgi:hypothetical protein